jgi:hypothetical protein
MPQTLPKLLFQFAALLSFWMLFSGCRDYDSTTRERAALRKMCDSVRDVPIAIEAHKRAHGNYPRTIAGLDIFLPRSAAAVSALNSSDGFVYSSSGDTYSIYKKLNWDGGIVFDSANPKWLYKLGEEKEFVVY